MKITMEDYDTTYEFFGGPTAIVPGENHYGYIVAKIIVPREDIINLKPEYLDGGFVLSTVVDPEVNLDDDGNLVVLINIEGLQIVDTVGPINDGV